ncbi:hypothetical protein D9613_004568 [Agrocybe pediades]|uniref:F-box domain-containing protein n=1 Tax=Agrocybe pediades TaxID=84607 RepID=A0A8H4VIL0_9AGAR|nr:hypothetical protein D9613_004568 [Agrocybe pediades]
MGSNSPKCTSCQKCDDTHIAIPNKLLSTCPASTQNCEACTRVKKLTSEVEEAAEKLKELIALLQRAKTDMNHHHSSSVSKLPPEILSTIFEVYTSDALPPCLQDEIEFDVPEHDVLSIPLVLSHVCHRWRQVAFSTPQIWTMFTISLDRCDGSQAEQDIISAWIGRTRNHPLTIHLHSSLEEDYHTALPKSSHLPALQVLASSSRQWRHFSARVPTYVLEYLGTQAQDIPLIETVGIGLRALQMDDAPIAHQLWRAVTTMRIEHISTEECLFLISSSPNLVTCIFEDIDAGGDEALWHSGQPVTEHLKIQHFTYDSSECCHLFYRVKLPNLRSLTCVGEGFTEEWSTILPVFFANSGLEKLEVFRLPSDSFTFAQLQSLLSRTPALTHLSLVCDGDHKEVVDGLLEHLQATVITILSGPGQSHRPFLPNLTSLELEMRGGPCFPWEKVTPCFAHIMLSSLPKEFMLRRLSSLKVVDTADLWEGANEDAEGGRLIPHNVLEHLIMAMRKGVEITFLDSEGYDLLEQSMESAGMDLDFYDSYMQGIKERQRKES